MDKFKLIAAPQFKAKVPIPVAGGPPVEVEFTFRHRTKTALDEWIASRADKSDATSFMEMVEGWELEEAFDQQSVELLLENYIGAALATYRVYVDQLIQARLGN